MTGPPRPDPADETRQFLAAVTEWAQRAMPAPPSGHPGPECQWCPLCQLASVLRGEHPELTERLAEAGAAAATAIRALLDNAARAGGPLAAPTPGPPVPDPAASEPDGPEPGGPEPGGPEPGGPEPGGPEPGGPEPGGPEPGGPGSAAGPAGVAPRRRPRPRIEHIPLDDPASGL